MNITPATINEVERDFEQLRESMTIANLENAKGGQVLSDVRAELEQARAYIAALIDGMTADQFNALVTAGKVDGIRTFLEFGNVDTGDELEQARRDIGRKDDALKILDNFRSDVAEAFGLPRDCMSDDPIMAKVYGYVNRVEELEKQELRYRARIAELEQAARWIPASNSPGDIEDGASFKDYLVCAWGYDRSKKFVFSAKYWKFLHEWSSDGVTITQYVICYRPLPPPPEAQS
jgi:hypothetical protein